MTDTADRTLTYRDRAKELRMLAEEVHNEEQRKLLRDVADEYEKMATKIRL